MVQSVSSSDVIAISSADHGAPLDVLGPHVVQLDGTPAVAVRAFLPLAKTVFLVESDPAGGEKRHELARLNPQGFFEVILRDRRETFPYQLEVIDAQGKTYRFHDPYAFPPLLTDYDLYLLGEGTHYRAYEKLGAHVREVNGIKGVHFAVWAPNARTVSVIGEFNGWDSRVNLMHCRGSSGIWELFIPGVEAGALYKYKIKSRVRLYEAEKADPYGFGNEGPPGMASVVVDLDTFQWHDEEWMRSRRESNALASPMAVYEVHLGSWRRKPDEGGRYLTYRELAHELAAYVKEMGYTHVELLPITEHPFEGSWGYQTIGYYAPTGRFGSANDFNYFVDYMHQNGIGVIVDWVPAHFPKDVQGLNYFDGTHLYEHADPRQGEHPDWGTLVFNYGRNEVRSFLLSNALFWLEKYHIDGLRVDAVASMLYLDYSRREGEWVPNQFGGRENLEAVDFLKRFNELVHAEYPGAVTIAEESTAWPMVSRPTYIGGLGFTFKWNMGWMHDILHYASLDPIHRRYHHNDITFSMLYAFTENFILPFSHDEVVHGKGSMLGKMPGDDWQKFANLRVLYGYMYAHPGKKLLFMGGEFGQWSEWNHNTSLDWHLLQYEPHQGLQRYVKDLNRFYREEKALHEVDFDWRGFAWINHSDVEQSVVTFLRRAQDPDDFIVFACNFTPVPRHQYRFGVPAPGFYREVMNSDSELYGGSNMGNYGGVEAEEVPAHGYPYSLSVTLPPLAMVAFKLRREG